jgi:two-component system response regulator MtrA
VRHNGDMGQRILVVDDDNALAEMIGIVLQGEGFEPHFCQNGSDALHEFRQVQPALVLLDVMLPGANGVTVCQQIRAESGIPIIMLTARNDTMDVVRGLEAGADDYVVKPFNPTELLARIRARLRQPHNDHDGVIELCDLTIDVSAHEVKRGDQLLTLTPLEFDLLMTFARNPERVYTREELLEQVWGYQDKSDTRLVNVHVQRLRSKVERDPDNPSIVATIRGVGYRAGA